MDSIKQKIIKKTNIRRIFDLGLFLYLILNQLHYIFALTGTLQLIVVGLINIIGIAMLVVVMFKKLDKRVFITLLSLIVFGGLSYFIIGNSSLTTYATVLRYLGIVMYLLYYKQSPKMMAAIMYTTLVLFVPVFFGKLGYNMFSKASRNYYSIILLMANFVYNKSFWDLKKKAPIFLTIAPMFISIFAGGRGGIIAYGIFFIGTVIENFKHIKENPTSKMVDDTSDTQEIPIITEKMIKQSSTGRTNIFINQYKREIIIIVIILLAFISMFAFKYINKKYNIFNFDLSSIVQILEDKNTEAFYGFEDKGLKSGGRVALIKTYLKNMFSNIKYFFFGVDLNIDPIFEKYRNNLHNSYLGLHSKFGIGGIILCGYLGFRALFIMIRKKEWGHIFIYLSALARVFLDTAAFPGHLDIILFYYFFRFYYLDTDKIYRENVSVNSMLESFKGSFKDTKVKKKNKR